MKKLHLRRVTTLGLLVLGTVGTCNQAKAITPVFNDASQAGQLSPDYQVTGLSLDAHPTYPNFGVSPFNATGAWPTPIASNSSSTVTFNRPDSSQASDFLSAASGSGIYSFTSETVYTLTQTNPVAALKSLTLQLYMAQGSDASATNNAYVGLPSLTLTLANSTTQVLSSSAGTISNATSAIVFGSSTTLEDFTFTWDLTGVSQPISSYDVAWTTGTHSITYGTDLTEVSTQAVPEPSTWALLLAGFVGLAYVGRARRTNPSI